MEKSGWPISPDEVLWKLYPKVVLLMNALSSLPQGKPTQLVPLVSESNERPQLPIGVTLSQ
jgi:nucleoid-associated protein YgaU